MITLNYTITEVEYKDFYYYVGWQAADRKSYRLRYHITSLVALVGTFLLLTLVTETMRFTITTVLIILVMAIGFYFYNNYRVKKHYHRYGKKIYNNSDNENAEMTIGETGISVKDNSADANYKWSAFVKKHETKDVYYLYTSLNVALIIPKRVFISADQKRSFDKMLSQYLPLQADLPTPRN